MFLFILKMFESNMEAMEEEIPYVSVLYAEFMEKMPFETRFKNYLIEEFGDFTERLAPLTKRIAVAQRVTGLLKDIFTNVNDESILYIGSIGKETYLFGRLNNKGEFLKFDGLHQNGCYGFKGYIYVIDKQNNVKTITHYIAIDEYPELLVVNSIDDQELNAAIHEFKV